jgi:hypothetical protein
MADNSTWANKIWCSCGNEFYVSKVKVETEDQAILFSQGYNEGLKATYEKVMDLMYDWNLDKEQRELIKTNLKDLVALSMPTVLKECRCQDDF